MTIKAKASTEHRCNQNHLTRLGGDAIVHKTNASLPDVLAPEYFKTQAIKAQNLMCGETITVFRMQDGRLAEEIVFRVVDDRQDHPVLAPLWHTHAVHDGQAPAAKAKPQPVDPGNVRPEYVREDCRVQAVPGNRAWVVTQSDGVKVLSKVIPVEQAHDIASGSDRVGEDGKPVGALPMDLLTEEIRVRWELFEPAKAA